jgi:hypothetical protein
LPKADGGIPRLTTFVVNILFAPLVNLLLAIRRRRLCGFAAVPLCRRNALTSRLHEMKSCRPALRAAFRELQKNWNDV